MELVAERPTYSAKQSASKTIPDAWIDRLFGRLAGLYGKHWLEQWAGIPIEGVKGAWLDALAGCDAEQIRKALEHLTTHSKFPPTAPEFASLCRQFRVEQSHHPMLPAPKTKMPEYMVSELVRIKGMDDPTKRDKKEWARKILADKTGKLYPYISYQFAREALGISA